DAGGDVDADAADVVPPQLDLGRVDAAPVLEPGRPQRVADRDARAALPSTTRTTWRGRCTNGRASAPGPQTGADSALGQGLQHAAHIVGRPHRADRLPHVTSRVAAPPS